MRYIKHNAILNFSQANDNEKKKIILEEISKAYLLFPKAVGDVLSSSNISFKSYHAQDLSEAVKSNPGNLKMLNRIVRLSFLVNKDGNVEHKKENRKKSFRQIMNDGNDFLKSHPEQIKEATLITRKIFSEKLHSNYLNNTIDTYLNMDGQQSKPQQPNQSSASLLMPLLILSVVGFVVYKVVNNKE
jgi:hypothetical protein